MKPLPVIAIFDIGRTNKKLLLFDENYQLAFEKSEQLPEVKDDDGDACEDITALTSWIRGSFRDIVSDPHFEIKAINYSTYGASLLHLGKGGIPVSPLESYLKPYPESLKAKFYETYGGLKAFSKLTASPALGSLNSGLQLYRIKHEKPHLFQAIELSLHLPQYTSWLFTGVACSDLTSIGCHTNLWDFTMGDYHSWVDKEGIRPKLAPIRESSEAFEINVGDRIIYSGIGLHDSSAALIPYLASFPNPFVLLSSGTWCISLNPFNEKPLTERELDKDCLCYLNYTGGAVKASRLFAGQLHDHQAKVLASHFHKDDDFYKEVTRRKDWRAFVATKHRMSPLRNSDPAEFDDFEHAYVAFMRDLVDLQVASTNLVLQPSVRDIYVDGGFSGNPIFMGMLAAAYPGKKVYAASVGQASALGAAMAIHAKWNSRDPKKVVDLGLHGPGE